MKTFKFLMLLIASVFFVSCACDRPDYKSVLTELSPEELAICNERYSNFQETYDLTRKINVYIVNEVDKAKFSSIDFSDVYAFRTGSNVQFLADEDRLTCIEYITIYDNIGKEKPKEETSSDYFN